MLYKSIKKPFIFWLEIKATQLFIEDLSSVLHRSWITIRWKHDSFSKTYPFFRGSHSIQLWALTDCLNNDCVLLHSWNDKRYWWQGPCTVTLLSTGIRWYSIDLFKVQRTTSRRLIGTSIQTLDFSGRTLSVHTDQGEISLGQRHRTTFYKNIVERMLEAMCHSFDRSFGRVVG